MPRLDHRKTAFRILNMVPVEAVGGPLYEMVAAYLDRGEDDIAFILAVTLVAVGKGDESELAADVARFVERMAAGGRLRIADPGRN